MKSFEPIFNKLNELFIEILPDYIREINIFYNDGIILKDFGNQNLLSKCNKLPCFQFSTEEAEYTDKDRIIENAVYKVSFEIMQPSFEETKIIEFWRYVEAINKMLEEVGSDIWLSIKMSQVSGNKIFFTIVV